MSRKQLALLEPTLVRQALLDAMKKTQPDGAMAQSGDVYRLGGAVC
ncbi:potassium-transporting ATPase subunit B [Klebsiella pneumoniae]|nr:potassium-transporting ATPase subunit B [Klebsiella pneumoniae]